MLWCQPATRGQSSLFRSHSCPLGPADFWGCPQTWLVPAEALMAKGALPQVLNGHASSSGALQVALCAPLGSVSVACVCGGLMGGMTGQGQAPAFWVVGCCLCSDGGECEGCQHVFRGTPCSVAVGLRKGFGSGRV